MKKITFLFFFGLLAVALNAQISVTITGHVSKITDQSPVANHPVFCFAGDSIVDPNGNTGTSIYTDTVTDADGNYTLTFDLPAGYTQAYVGTVTFCQPDFVANTVVDVSSGAAQADFQICDDSFPPPPGCFVDINAVPLDSLTFAFSANYFGSDPAQQAVTYQWIFGDGTASYEANPIHHFAVDGFYLVTLTVTGSDSCTSTAQFPIQTGFWGFPDCMGYINYVQVDSTTFNFSADLYDSNGNSTQAAVYNWDFGDGETSTDPAPAHTYASEGVYSVQLHATTADGCEIHTCDVVFALDNPIDTFWYGCQAMFAVNIPFPDSPYIDPNGNPVNGDPLTVSFVDLSLGGVTSWLWSFGDGTSSTEPNPTHTYAVAGTYTVGLSITTQSGCESTVAFEICVGSNCWFNIPGCQAMFIPLPDSLGGNGIQFVDLSLSNGPITSWQWSFGDGTASTEQNPFHEYSQSGTYTVSLTITSDSCNSTITFELDTEHPWNFSNNASPSKLGVAQAQLAAHEAVTRFESVQLFPNPAQDEFSVAFNCKKEGAYQLDIQDLTGKTLITNQLNAVQGFNAIHVNGAPLPSGMYLVTLRSGDEVQALKLMKQ